MLPFRSLHPGPVPPVSLLACALLLVAAPLHAQRVDVPGPPASERLAAALASGQPQLEATEADARALREAAEGRRSALMDPMLMYSLYLDGPGSMDPGRTRHMVEISQQVPWFGVRDARATPLLLQAETAEVQRDAALLALRGELHRALLAIARADALLAELDEQAALLEDTVDTLAATLAWGQGTHAGLLEFTLSLELLEEERDRLRAAREEAVAAAGALFAPGRAPAALDLRADDPILQPRTLPDEGALATRWPAHPELQAADRAAAATLAEGDTLRIERRPAPTFTFGVGAMPMMDSGTGMMFLAGVGVPLPVWKASTRADERAAGARAEAITLRGDERLARLQGEADAARSAHREARTRMQRYEENLVPLVDDLIDRLRADVELGRARTSDLVLAYERRRALGTAALRARFDLLDAQVRFDTATGGSLYGEAPTPSAGGAP